MGTEAKGENRPIRDIEKVCFAEAFDACLYRRLAARGTFKIVRITESLKKYHQYLVRRAVEGDALSRHIDMSVQSVPWISISLVGLAIGTLTDAKFHLTPDQRGYLILPFLGISFIGEAYVICVITIYGVWKSLNSVKPRRPWGSQ